MLSRSNRLSGEQLNLVIEKGKVLHSPFFWLRFRKEDGLSRFAVLSPVKIVKTAVKRNYFRRKVYSIIRSFQDGIISGQHIVICPKEPAIKADMATLAEQVREIFVKSGLLK